MSSVAMLSRPFESLDQRRVFARPAVVEAIVVRGEVFYVNTQPTDPWFMLRHATSYDIWLQDYVPLPNNMWLRTAVRQIVQHTGKARRLTVSHNASSVMLEPGMSATLEPGGYLRRLTAEQVSERYYSDQEARAFGFNSMSSDRYRMTCMNGNGASLVTSH